MFNASFAVPGEPRGKQRAKHRIVKTHDGREFTQSYTPKQTVSYESTIRLFGDTLKPPTPLLTPVVMSVGVYRSIPASYSKKKRMAAILGQIVPTSKPDIDNVLKAAMDALNTVWFHDDSQVVGLHVYKFFSESPRLVIHVKEWEAKQQ